MRDSKTSDGTAAKRRWSPRAYRPGDEELVLELHRSVYPEKEMDRSEWMRWWRWQHLDNPSGPPFIWFADAVDRLAGQYEIVRFRMRIAGAERLAAHSQDTMTHPDFRRQGIFEELAGRAYRHAVEDGLRLVYGFPNANSYPGFVRKLSWLEICNIPIATKPLNARNMLRRRIRNPLLAAVAAFAMKAFLAVFARGSRPPNDPDLSVEEASSFGEEADELWRKASGDFEIICVRDRAHLNWRYVDIPRRRYKILVARKKGAMAGYAVLGLAAREGFAVGEIVDLFAVRDESVLHLLLSRAVDYFREQRADVMYGWLPDDIVYRRAFRKAGFINRPSKRRFVVLPLSKDLAEGYVVRYANWFVMMGDSDFH